MTKQKWTQTKKPARGDFFFRNKLIRKSRQPGQVRFSRLVCCRWAWQPNISSSLFHWAGYQSVFKKLQQQCYPSWENPDTTVDSQRRSTSRWTLDGEFWPLSGLHPQLPKNLIMFFSVPHRPITLVYSKRRIPFYHSVLGCLQSKRSRGFWVCSVPFWFWFLPNAWKFAFGVQSRFNSTLWFFSLRMHSLI